MKKRLLKVTIFRCASHLYKSAHPSVRRSRITSKHLSSTSTTKGGCCRTQISFCLSVSRSINNAFGPILSLPFNALGRIIGWWTLLRLYYVFLDASSHQYIWVCPSLGQSVGPSVGPSVHRRRIL